MRPKSYWEIEQGSGDPFSLPKRISKGLADTSARHENSSATEAVVKYIWMYVTDDGLVKDAYSECEDCCPSLDDWLNIVDEASALGAEWLVVYAGASLSQNTDLWKICSWAQDVHAIKVGIHVASGSMNEEDFEHLNKLEPAKTHIIADKADLGDFGFLKSRGFALLESNIRPEERADTCENPEAIACVGADGTMYSCGLVLGDERYSLGNASKRPLSDIMHDESLPHRIPDMASRPARGCEACPPLMAKRLEELGQAVSEG